MTKIIQNHEPPIREEDVERIAKEWYTTQRGRVVGNTRAWDDLDFFEKRVLIRKVRGLLNEMARYRKI